ncbi:MAG: ribosomal-processing cysteine protease Prp [Solirubrobacterales bacterium]
MTRVELAKDEHGVVVAFLVEGHAKFDNPGEDIVCAAISAITQTALRGLLEYLETKPAYRHVEEEALIACSLVPGTSESDREIARIILGTMELGLREIEFLYDEYLTIEIRRC